MRRQLIKNKYDDIVKNIHLNDMTTRLKESRISRINQLRADLSRLGIEKSHTQDLEKFIAFHENYTDKKNIPNRIEFIEIKGFGKVPVGNLTWNNLAWEVSTGTDKLEMLVIDLQIQTQKIKDNVTSATKVFINSIKDNPESEFWIKSINQQLESLLMLLDRHHDRQDEVEHQFTKNKIETFLRDIQTLPDLIISSKNKQDEKNSKDVTENNSILSNRDYADKLQLEEEKNHLIQLNSLKDVEGLFRRFQLNAIQLSNRSSISNDTTSVNSQFSGNNSVFFSSSKPSTPNMELGQISIESPQFKK